MHLKCSKSIPHEGGVGGQVRLWPYVWPQ